MKFLSIRLKVRSHVVIDICQTCGFGKKKEKKTVLLIFLSYMYVDREKNF